MANNCRNECDIINNDGCNDDTEICENGILEENGTSFKYTYCKCTIPPLQLAGDGSCQYKQTNCNDGTSQDCHGNGKCVQLLGQTEKTCFCKITHAGKYCQNPRTCESINEVYAQRLCLNDGSCHETEDEPFYECECESGFYGTNCEKIHPCHPFKVEVLLFFHIFQFLFIQIFRITVSRPKYVINSKRQAIIAPSLIFSWSKKILYYQVNKLLFYVPLFYFD